MNASTWDRLNALFAQSPLLVGQAVEKVEVDQAASSIGCSFDPDYAEFIRRYGGAMIGADPIFGLRQAEVMGRDTVIRATKHFRSQKWPGVDELYVISIDGGGNPVGIDQRGRVLASYHDGGGITPLANRFEEFVLQLLDRSGD